MVHLDDLSVFLSVDLILVFDLLLELLVLNLLLFIRVTVLLESRLHHLILIIHLLKLVLIDDD